MLIFECYWRFFISFLFLAWKIEGILRILAIKQTLSYSELKMQNLQHEFRCPIFSATTLTIQHISLYIKLRYLQNIILSVPIEMGFLYTLKNSGSHYGGLIISELCPTIPSATASQNMNDYAKMKTTFTKKTFQRSRFHRLISMKHPLHYIIVQLFWFITILWECWIQFGSIYELMLDFVT